MSLQSHPHLVDRFHAVSRQLAFEGRTRAEFADWKCQFLTTLLDLLGYHTFDRAEPQPEITEEIDCGDHVRQRLVLQTEPDIHMPVYVLVPKTPGPHPAVIACHGHGAGGKAAVAGVRDDQEVAAKIDHYRKDYGLAFVRQGCVVFCPDARGFGERQEAAVKAQGSLLPSSCDRLARVAYPLGQTVAGMWTWDLHRLIDYIETRRDCIPGLLACVGLSGGGLQTLMATATDERIKAAIISGYFYGVKEAILDAAHCWCNYVPHLWQAGDMGDIGALIAPRPLCIESGDADPLNGASGLANVRSQVDIARRAYAACGAEDRLRHVTFEGVHRWDGTESVPWLMERLQAVQADTQR